MLARCGGELTVPQSLPVGDDGRWVFEASVLLRGTRSSWSLEGVLTVRQSLPVGDDGRRGVRGQRASPELVVRGRWAVCRRSICQQ